MSAAAEAVDAVVHEHAVRHVAVERVDLEVVHGTRVVGALGGLDDRLDEVSLAAVDEDRHSRVKV